MSCAFLLIRPIGLHQAFVFQAVWFCLFAFICAAFYSQQILLVFGSGIFLGLVRIAVLIFAAVFCVSVFAVLRICLTFVSSVCWILAVLVFRFVIFSHLCIPPVECYRITLYILPKTNKNIHQNDIAFFSSLYYNCSCKKNLPFKNFFYITPYLIICTPLEIPGSSPTGCFSLDLCGFVGFWGSQFS